MESTTRIRSVNGISILQLVPMVPHSKGRPLPLVLGRVELVTWWLGSCCRSRGKKRRLCRACETLVTNAQFLSKSMLELDASRTLHVMGKNSKCMFLNSKPMRSGEMPVQEGDVLSFGSNPTWMRFQFRRLSASIITPEAGKKSKCSAVKKNSDPNSETVEKGGRTGTIENNLISRVTKRKRAESDTESSPRSRRRLFAAPLEQCVAPFTQQEDETGSGMNSCQTTKRVHLEARQLQASQDSSVLSLPRFPSSESYESDENQGWSPIRVENEDPHSKNVSSGIDDLPSTVNTRATQELQLVSDLSMSQWKALQRSAASGSRVRRALLNLLVARNCCHREGEDTLIPDLLHGTMISRK